MPNDPYCPVCKMHDQVRLNRIVQSFYCGRCNHNFTPTNLPNCSRCKTSAYTRVENNSPGWYTCSKCNYAFRPDSPIGWNIPQVVCYPPLPNFTNAITQQILAISNPKLPEGPMFLVLNNGFQPVSIFQQGFQKTLSEEDIKLLDTSSLAINSKEIAEKFAEWMASKHQGQRFYLFEMLDNVQTADPPIKWGKK